MEAMKITGYMVLTLFIPATLLFGSSIAERGGDNDGGDSSSTPASSSPCAGQVDLSAVKLPFATSNFSCSNAWSTESFQLLYQHTGPNLWSFVLTAPDSNAYIAIGFAPGGGMIGASTVAGWVPSGGAGVVKQYYLGGYGSSQCPPNQGSLKVGMTTIVSQASKLYMAFQLTTSQPETKLVYAVGPPGTLPGSDLLLAQHKDMVRATIDYTTGLSSTSGSGTDILKKAHGFTAIFGWGVLMPIGVMMARYFKHKDPFWFNAHISIQGVGFVFGVVCLITGFALEDKVGVEVDTHKALGIFILVLGCLQVMAFLIRPDKAAKVRRYWNWYHHNVGRSAIIIAIANIFYGISLAHEDQSWNIGYGVFLGIWVVVCVALEVRMRLRN